MTSRQDNTREGIVRKINVMMALHDIGPGDGLTVLVPGSHKVPEVHPRLAVDGAHIVASHTREAALRMQEVYLEAGDALLFTDAATHGAAHQCRLPPYDTLPVLARFVRTRFNYEPSAALLRRLTPERDRSSNPFRRAGLLCNVHHCLTLADRRCGSAIAVRGACAASPAVPRSWALCLHPQIRIRQRASLVEDPAGSSSP